MPVVRVLPAPKSTGPVDCIRWNPVLPKAFDIAGEQFPPRSIEEAFVSKYLGVEIKNLERRVEQIPSVRMGAFLTAIDTVIRKWSTDDIRNLNWQGEETPPQYDVIQLNSTKSSDFLIDGMRFVRQGDPDTGTKATMRVEPRWYGLQITTYGLKTAGTAETLLGEIVATARDINFLKGEAFSLSGEFLPKTTETFDDLFLEPSNAASITRVVSLINARGKSLENRGVLLMGPPGTGKTLSARIVRNDAKATFIWVSSRDFHYAGSFGGFTQAFDIARECAPSVIVFEDVDNWLSDRTVDLLKTEMDGISRSSGVVTMMTTNYPELLPAALIDRPGRFHDVLKFDLPDAAARKKMLQRWLSGVESKDLDEAVIATAGYSGAHVRELARFAQIIGEQDRLPPAKALSAALAKLKEQRDLITTTQSRGSTYKMAGVLTKSADAGLDMHRAYATLEIKSIDEDQRIITGVASHAETDRQGDLLEPDGALFKLPLPFLWQHNQLAPIGEVFAARVVNDGIEIQARVFDLPDAPPGLRARLDEAWVSIKSRLVRGLSVGWKPIKAKRIVETGGLHALQWLWLELSAVTIPANESATILMVKSHDGRYTASGDRSPVVVVRQSSVSPGVSGSSSTIERGQHTMKTTSEQISAFEATRLSKAARMNEIMSTSADTGSTLDEAQSDEYAGLETEVKSLDVHLTRLRSLEDIQKKAAVPVAGRTPTDGAASRSVEGARVITIRPVLEKGIEFARYAMCLAAAKGFTPQALAIAESRYPDMERIHFALKAAVAAGTTTDPNWAGALVQYQQFSGDFVDFLRPRTISASSVRTEFLRCSKFRSTSWSRVRPAVDRVTGSARAAEAADAVRLRYRDAALGEGREHRGHHGRARAVLVSDGGNAGPEVAR
jgi:AAA+ superfamily predicted ATPase